MVKEKFGENIGKSQNIMKLIAILHEGRAKCPYLGLYLNIYNMSCVLHMSLCEFTFCLLQAF